jgi:hypothetical protein
MADEQREFWSGVAQRYDRVVDRQIGPATRGLVRDRLAQEKRLGRLVELGCGTSFATQALAGKVHEPGDPLHRTRPDADRDAPDPKTGGTLIVANLDPGALGGLDRVFCWIRTARRTSRSTTSGP